MSYISLLLPAFHFNTTDINEILKQCSIQLNLSLDKFELLRVNDKTTNINYAIKLLESSLSLRAIEELIYQTNCIQNLSQKAFESLQLFSKKWKKDDLKKDLMNDNVKLRELLISQIEYSDNFRMNTEKTLKKIKDEFRTMVKELETLKIKSTTKDEQQNLGGGGSGKNGGVVANNMNNQKVNFSSSSININNQVTYNNYSLPLKVNLIK